MVILLMATRNLARKPVEGTYIYHSNQPFMQVNIPVAWMVWVIQFAEVVWWWDKPLKYSLWKCIYNSECKYTHAYSILFYMEISSHPHIVTDRSIGDIFLGIFQDLLFVGVMPPVIFHSCLATTNFGHFCPSSVEILLMEEILHHLGWC